MNRSIEEQYQRLAYDPSVGRHLSDRELDRLLHRSLLHLDRELQQAVLSLVRFEPANHGQLEQAMFGVVYRPEPSPGTLTVYYDRLLMDRLWQAVQMVGGTETIYLETLSSLIEHELWHVVNGDVFDQSLLARYSAAHEDPLWFIAVELRVNNGCLRNADDIPYPLITWKRLGIEQDIRRWETEHRPPPGWIFDLQQLYQVLSFTLPHSKRKYSIERINGVPAYLVVEETVYTPNEPPKVLTHRFPLTNLLQVTSNANTDGTRLLRQIVDLSPGWTYDPDQNRVVRDRSILKGRKGFHVQWSRLTSVLGIRRTVGFPRRIGHLYPPDRCPLTTKRPSIREVYVFIDSSASISDELLSQLEATVSRSPYRVQVRYFHTEVTEKPHPGGTRYECIEQYLRSLARYPWAVLVLTDGEDFGPVFRPLHPHRWYWIVDGPTSRVECIGGTVLPVRRQV